MASDHGGEAHPNVLDAQTRPDDPSSVDTTSALRDRLRLHLNVRNIVPGDHTSSTESGDAESGQMEWSSVLDSLSNRLHPEKRHDADSIPAPTVITVPVATTAPPAPSPHPYSPQPFAPQPLSVPTRVIPAPSAAQVVTASPPLAPLPSPLPLPVPPPPTVAEAAAGRQIFVPVGMGDMPGPYGDQPRAPNDSPLISSHMSAHVSASGPAFANMGVPYLAQPTRVPSAQRVVTSRFSESLLAPPARPRRSDRHPFRTLLSALVVISLLGGSAYTGWYFLIKNKVVWAADIQPLATFVEQTTHSTFTDNVIVETLSVPEYEVKLGIDVLSRSYPDADGSFSTLRAVGLVSQTPSPVEVGRLAAAAITAYYKPEKRTIFRLEGNTPLFDLAMLRALSVALADQRTGWSSDPAVLTDAQRIGVRASVDMVGSYVVHAKIRLDPQLGSLADVEATARTSAVGITAESRPTYLNAVLGSYLYGGSTSPAAEPNRPLSGVVVPTSDAVLFDPTRSANSPPAVVASPTPGAVSRSLGLQFWYLVLLPVVGPGFARLGALTWIGDSTVTNTTIEGRTCLNATIATASNADQALLAGLLAQWASSRPASSLAIASAVEGNLVRVGACGATEPTAQPTGPTDAMLLYSAALQESSAGYDLLRLGLPRTQQAWTCAVRLVRNGALPDYVTGSTDVVQLNAMSNILAQCPAA